MKLKRMWVVSREYDYEGPGTPEAVFPSIGKAREFVATINDSGERRHKRVTDFAVSEAYVSPPSIAAIEAEDMRRYKGVEAA